MTAEILGRHIFLELYSKNIKCDGKHRFRSRYLAFDYLAHQDDNTMRYSTVEQCQKCLDWHIVRKPMWRGKADG